MQSSCSARQCGRPSNGLAMRLLVPLNSWAARTAQHHLSLHNVASTSAANTLQLHTHAGCTYTTQAALANGCCAYEQHHGCKGRCSSFKPARHRVVVMASNDKQQPQPGDTPNSTSGTASPQGTSGSTASNGIVNVFRTAWQEAVQEANDWDVGEELKKQEQLWEQQLRAFREGPQVPSSKEAARQPPPATAAAPRNAAGAAADTAQSTSSEAEQQLPLYKRPWLTWAMCAWTWWLLFQQWLPLMGALTTPAGSWSEVVLRFFGVALLVPDTPAGNQWQLDMIHWLSGSAGSWAAPLSASFLHSGLVPTWVFTRGLFEAGSSIEGIYAPLVMAIHVVLAAYGAAVMQLLFSPVPRTVIGPGMVCGLYAGMSMMLFREKQALRAIASTTSSSSDVLAAATGSAQAVNAEAVQGFLELPTVPRSALVTWALALLLGAFQPMLGIWGVLGGCLGGLLAGLSSVFIVYLLRWSAWFLLRTVTWLLGNILRCLLLMLNAAIALVGSAAGAVQDFIAGFRQL